MAMINKVTATLLSAAALLSFAPAAHAGLVALYTYDNAANIGLDSSGHGNNLVSLNAAVGSAAGVYGGAADFSGINALVSNSGTLAGLPTGASSYTISSWINPDSAGGNGAGGIVGWGNYGATNQVDAFRMNGNYGLHNYWWDNDLSAGASSDLTTGSGVNGWHFVAATFDAASGLNAIYIDGVLVSSRYGYGLNAQAMNFAVGRTVGNEFFDGQMDNTAIFNTALTLTQLNAISTNNFSAYGVAAVPEPSSVLLLAIGALAVAGVSRRKKPA